MPVHEAVSFTVEEVETLFYTICDGYHSGAISIDVVKYGFETLAFFDKEGIIWTMGVNTGKWYHWDGANWNNGTPEGPLYQAYQVEEDPEDQIPQIDLTNPIMKKLLKKGDY